ncbi:hypothetical protein C0J52_16524 [Blattella germanica]|nr:hypothetical protein C0J52_16524 [Blattella germanica]
MDHGNVKVWFLKSLPSSGESKRCRWLSRVKPTTVAQSQNYGPALHPALNLYYTIFKDFAIMPMLTSVETIN